MATSTSTVFCENGSVLEKYFGIFRLSTPLDDVVKFFQSQLLKKGLEEVGYFSFHSGKPITLSASKLPLSYYTTSDSFLRLRWNVKCLGGKGGFGSMLRAQGGKMTKKRGKKNENDTDSFRTLEGRRMKNIRQAKELAAFLDKKQTNSESTYQRKKEQLQAKISNDISSSVQFHDVTHSETLQSLNEAIQGSVKCALEKSEYSEYSGSSSSSSACASSSSSISNASLNTTENVTPKVLKNECKSLDFFDQDLDDNSDSSESSEDEDDTRKDS